MYKHLSCLALCTLLAAPGARADSCPSPDAIRKRDISSDYDWTVDEGVSLEQLLGVTDLRAVTVMNAGEFIACDYDLGKQKKLRLYAKPEGGLCVVTEASGKWNKSDEGDLSCLEKDLSQCRFQFNCADNPRKPSGKTQ